MSDRTKIVELRQRLTAERRRIVNDAASATSLPPAKFLSSLADLDGSLAAVEAVLDQERSGDAVNRDLETSSTLN